MHDGVVTRGKTRVHADETANPDEVIARIRARTTTLPPSEAKVAVAVLRDPAQVAALTVMELKKTLGVSEATIVRAARSLGFAGYPQLRLALAGVAGQRRMSAPGFVVAQDISLNDSPDQVVAKLSATEQQAIRDTAAQLDGQVLETCATAIAQAERIVVFGVGASGLVAQDLQQKLTRSGLLCLSPTDIEMALTAAALLKPTDAAVLISERGANSHTINVLHAAVRTGATTIAITGAERSRLAQDARHVLIAATHDTDFRPAALASRMSQLLVIDCLFVAVIQRTWSASSTALAATRAAVDAQGP